MESQNFKEPPSKKKKEYERDTETDKEKREKFQWTEEMVEYLIHSLKRYKVMCDFSWKDLDPVKTFPYNELRIEMATKYEGFSPIETAANPRADLSIQERKERIWEEIKTRKQAHWHMIQ